MIDLHVHALPGIDDGPESIEGSVALSRAAANAGIATVVATPHVSPRYPNDAETIDRLVGELRERLASEQIALDVHGGAEVATTLLPKLEATERERLCLGNGPWMLLESPHSVQAASIAPSVRELQDSGIRVLLAHPERAPMFHRNPELLAELVGKGALTSITAGSLVGRFGNRVRRFTLELLGAEMVHSVASDSHDRYHRPPSLASELEQAGITQLADWLTDEVPAAILEGAEIPQRPSVGYAFGRTRWWRRRHRSSRTL
jgi:protein-tyrosine phosphatase